mgnify:FL=1
MPFRVSHATWLRVEADRIQSIILMPRHWRRAWTPQSLQEALHDIGLDYSLPDVQALNDELHRRGVVEDVA